MINFWLAFILDILLGDPYWFPHPVKVIGMYIIYFEKLIRMKNWNKELLRIWGICLVCSTIGLTYIIGLFALNFSKSISIFLYNLLNISLIWLCISPKGLYVESMKVYHALRLGDLEKSRYLLSRIVGRDTDNLQDEDIIKATVETVAENTSDGVIAPLFYIGIGGPLLGLVYKAVNTLDSMVGYKNEKYQHFGWASAKIDDLFNYIPARITGFLYIISAYIWKMDYKNSWRILLRDRSKHASPNAGWPESAVAGALKIQLGGPNRYFGKVVDKEYIGDRIKKVEYKDILRVNKLMYTATMIFLILMSAIFKI
ncbi:adenosylcobinamide-phosphate synthase CbiB [Anaerobranca gottschalkii]|uniref:Cobalamin biosynthesis protein CobD n=1 Tax=Anaerobranca gottschalkii DSM 13577 TaxID=1120990 RepID=A0A1I0A1N8_9FIRM|nr:adenosylcobinamide-phosphate synthase CbiB [Anaerobranca gottschalkii]SES87945.1 adenosylcobinamide-phosphate synthase [Anaerobranca gottschalkii DSM 13577]